LLDNALAQNIQKDKNFLCAPRFLCVFCWFLRFLWFFNLCESAQIGELWRQDCQRCRERQEV